MGNFLAKFLYEHTIYNRKLPKFVCSFMERKLANDKRFFDYEKDTIRAIATGYSPVPLWLWILKPIILFLSFIFYHIPVSFIRFLFRKR